MRPGRLLLAVGAGALLAPALQGTAGAAPQKEVLTLVCGGTSYEVQVQGRGDFTPAHDLHSTTVFVPHAFGAFSATITDATGAQVDAFTDPPVVQGSGKQKNDVSCSFTITFVGSGGPDDLPLGWTFTGSGTVTGQVTGR